MSRERTINWVSERSIMRMIDQRKLPLEHQIVDISTVDETFVAIKGMTVRGAPAIGATGAYGMCLVVPEVRNKGGGVTDALTELRAAKKKLDAARPTAVNLMWATQRLLQTAATLIESAPGCSLDNLQTRLVEEANLLADQDVAINRRMGKFGAEVVPHGSNILHHCNTGSLATVDIGTALGVIYECHWQGKNIHVWCNETRPRLQGARLSAWELMKEKVPMHLIADNAAGLLMLNGKVDVVIFGADRCAANGDVCNKIGSYNVAVVARENGIPVYPCVPTSTIDLDCASGKEIPIEERPAEEVTTIGTERVAPYDCPVYNPAFDVTPSKYVTGIITEEGICYPPFTESLKKAKFAAEKRIEADMKARNMEQAQGGAAAKKPRTE